jgi:RNA polymerase sigma-70 factor (ECF subfamily)
VLGLDAEAIASAFLVPPATMGQRLVRAKTRIRETGIPFRVPDRDELPERLGAVLAAIYAAFTEGWVDAIGAETRRRDLATEAIWLGRIVAALLPDQPEPLGLLALMLYAEARRPARRDGHGRYVPLSQQDMAQWDAARIDEAEAALRRASAFGPTGRFQLEAAVQSAHCARRTVGRTDWTAIRKLYDVLALVSPSPVTTINRAVAMAEEGELGEAIAALDGLSGDKRMQAYQPYWAARAELLSRLGRAVEAVDAYDRAIDLASDDAVRDFLRLRRGAVAPTPS